MRPLTFVLLLAGCFATGTAVGDGAATNCDTSSTISPLATETASAGYLSNITNRAGSIRATSNRMLASAIEAAGSGETVRRVIFNSIPELSMKADSDDHMCDRHEKATTKAPLEFDGKRFASVDELTNWIMEFTQGKGADGRSLYEQCPGNCSPQYTWWIDPEETDLVVEARVVCGPPRDRDGNKYHLSTALAASCPTVLSQ